MKKYLIIIAVMLLAFTNPLSAGFATDCPTLEQQQAAYNARQLAPTASGTTAAQQAKDRQQQAKDIQQMAKDQQQADTDARLIAFSHMLDRREFLYNSQKPDPNYKCPQPCCNEPVVQASVCPTPTPGCSPKPVECPKSPSYNGTTCQAKQKKENGVIGGLVDGVPVKEYLNMRKEAKKKFSSDPFQAANELTKLKDEYKAKHTNRSGHADGTNPGGQTHNPNGYDNPGFGNHVAKGL